MAVILNLAAAVVLLAGAYAMGRKDGYDAAWADIAEAVEDVKRWKAELDERKDGPEEEIILAAERVAEARSNGKAD